MNPCPQWRLFLGCWLGLLLVHLAFWSGACGYNDLYEYGTLVEQIWNHGTWTLPDGNQSRFCWGFPVLLQPFQAVGAGMEWLTGHDQLSRWALAVVPLMSATVAAVLLLMFPSSASWKSRCLAMSVLGLSASSLYYSRMLHLEPVVGLAILLGFWLAVYQTLWAAGLAGILLAVGPSCHFAFLPGTAVLALGQGWQRWQRGARGHAILLLCSYATIAGITLVMNQVRYGSWNTDGYSRQEAVGWTVTEFIPNLPMLILVLFTVPWVPLALIHGARSTSQGRWYAAAFLLAITCWLGTWQFRVFPLRYMTVWIMVAAVMLPPALDWLATRRFGAILGRWLLIWGIFASSMILAGWQESRPFWLDTENPMHHRVLAETWLFPAEPSHHRSGHYTWKEVRTGQETTAPYVPVTVLGLAATVIFLLAGFNVLWWTTRRIICGPSADGGKANP